MAGRGCHSLAFSLGPRVSNPWDRRLPSSLTVPDTFDILCASPPPACPHLLWFSRPGSNHHVSVLFAVLLVFPCFYLGGAHPVVTRSRVSHFVT